MDTETGLPALRGLPGCLGTAENFSGTVPVYSGIELSRLVRGGLLDPWLADASRVLQLFPTSFDSVRSLALPSWQGMDHALVGLGRWQGVSTLVYNKSAVIHLLDVSIIDTSEDREDFIFGEVAAHIYTESMLPACLGSRTPFFFETNKAK